MLISEIFKSIDGEGSRAGYPATFIRTFGCPLRCKYCDSLYAIEGTDYKEMSVDEVIDQVASFGLGRITLTGGEPLIQKDALELVKRLSQKGYSVQIETSGAVDFSPYLSVPNVMITMDWKSIYSGMSGRMLSNLLPLLRPTDIIKFVVANKEDLEQMKGIVSLRDMYAQVFISPVFGQIEPKDIVDYILDNNLQNCRVQLQLHKYIWPADMRGV